ncbi:MAG: endonuclease/exonuclease/phosphatase family protein [Thermodesulfobacteriota bacterium]|nr:endonuclease/exonuclease/phosphatase family protein [Thermodesulfobacteriota bacterium]
MKWSRSKKVVISLCGFVCGLVVLFLWTIGGIQVPTNIKGQISNFGTEPPLKLRDTRKIVVLTWNIAFAYGFGSDGNGYVPRTTDEMAKRLERIGEIILASDADIVLLQEVDFDSHRSHHVDQLKELSYLTGLRYAAYAVSWRAGYIPFPYWPPENQFGAMCSGGAILSRYPIISNRVVLHSKPHDNPLWYNAFYLFRYMQEVQIQWGKQVLYVSNNHLEAYDQANRAHQARMLVQRVRKLTSDTQMVVVGGDMNTIPLEATIRYNYPDNIDDDYRGDSTMQTLRKMSGFCEIVKADDYRKDESAFFTFPAHAPNRRLDYLFIPKEVCVEDVRIIYTDDLSDHLPVRAELKWP